MSYWHRAWRRRDAWVIAGQEPNELFRNNLTYKIKNALLRLHSAAVMVKDAVLVDYVPGSMKPRTTSCSCWTRPLWAEEPQQAVWGPERHRWALPILAAETADLTLKQRGIK